jgi:hypothetical protein
MRTFSKVLLTLALVLALLLPLSNPEPVQAQEKEIGYLWSLFFDFEQSFDGVLTVEVGPWKDGELVEVHETSTTSVKCERVGVVYLQGGDAVFEGAGHIQCFMDLGEIVWNNHSLVINEIDSYGSMVLRTRLNSAVSALAPIFTHADAAYSIDFSQTHATTLKQELWNNAGLLQASFPGAPINSWHTYTQLYSCISNGGPCDATFRVGAQVQSVPTAGGRIQFSTGPATFDIGRNGGTFFTGRMSSLLIDPGNSAH